MTEQSDWQRYEAHVHLLAVRIEAYNAAIQALIAMRSRAESSEPARFRLYTAAIEEAELEAELAVKLWRTARHELQRRLSGQEVT